MSLKAYPILYINLVGEMIYILEQRLKQMDHEKSIKVINDIVDAVFSKERLNDIFQPCTIPSRATLRKTFDDLAHVSCMKLTDASMDKLFDLMTMTSKFQTLSIVYPEQMLVVALNHIRGIKLIVSPNQDVAGITDVHTRLLSLYRPSPPWEWLLIRNELLFYYQDCKTKISLLMRQDRQCDDGTFRTRLANEPYWLQAGDTIPGVVNYYDDDGNVYRRDEPGDSRWKAKPKNFGFIKYADDYDLPAIERSTNLGDNLFANGTTLDFQQSTEKVKKEPMPHGDELKLLESIFGRSSKIKDSESSDEAIQLITLNVFDEDINDISMKSTFAETNSIIENNIKKIDASRNKKSLDAIMSEMKLDERPLTKASKRPRGTDILSMMDEAANRPATGHKRIEPSMTYRGRQFNRHEDDNIRANSIAPSSRLPTAKSRPSSIEPRTRVGANDDIVRSPSISLNITTRPQWNAIYGKG
ncbi:unnamed protein product [Auanema sp. JU1783]|nr:unnamed protein product [Auanema sp. JU1783]